MFVYYFVQVEQPFVTVEADVLRMIPGLGGWGEDAYRDGERLRARVGPQGHWQPAKKVLIEIGSPVRGSTETWIPLTWSATRVCALFPRLEGDIVISEVSTSFTQIAFRGMYEVPLGTVGRTLDRVLLHRLAEATIKAFLDRIAQAIDRPAVEVDAE